MRGRRGERERAFLEAEDSRWARTGETEIAEVPEEGSWRWVEKDQCWDSAGA